MGGSHSSNDKSNELTISCRVAETGTAFKAALAAKEAEASIVRKGEEMVLTAKNAELQIKQSIMNAVSDALGEIDNRTHRATSLANEIIDARSSQAARSATVTIAAIALITLTLVIAVPAYVIRYTEVGTTARYSEAGARFSGAALDARYVGVAQYATGAETRMYAEAARAAEEARSAYLTQAAVARALAAEREAALYYGRSTDAAKDVIGVQGARYLRMADIAADEEECSHNGNCVVLR